VSAGRTNLYPFRLLIRLGHENFNKEKNNEEECWHNRSYRPFSSRNSCDYSRIRRRRDHRMGDRSLRSRRHHGHHRSITILPDLYLDKGEHAGIDKARYHEAIDSARPMSWLDSSGSCPETLPEIQGSRG